MHKDTPTLEHRVAQLRERMQQFKLNNPDLYPTVTSTDTIDNNVASISTKLNSMRVATYNTSKHDTN